MPPLQAGKIVYEQQCAACHGINGEGNGAAAVWLYPKPRDFSAGLFKIKSTPGSALPSDADLLQTVTRGVPGTSMPSFIFLPERDCRNVVEYVKFLTSRPDESGKRVSRFAEEQPASPIVVPPEPAATIEAVTQGRAVYDKFKCAACHGETGVGDGPSAAGLKDNAGMPLRPRDFNSGAFRGGATGRDLYLRIATGLAGTPMPSYGDDMMKPEERWALVQYIQSLRRKDSEINDILAPPDGVIHATHVSGALPTDPVDPVWEAMDSTRVPLNPLWPENTPIPAVAVRAVHDGNRLAILCQWRDSVMDGSAVRPQDFQDAVAIQFSMNEGTPFIGMGDKDNPVNLWQWKAGWQQEVEGQRPDVNTTFPSMHVDGYPEAKPLYRTAEAAGNLAAAPHTSSVEDANARGFGTLKSQPASSQNVKGRGVWRDGFWSVVFVRQLQSRDSDDARFRVGKSTPLAFAVWDGQNRDRNGRKVISNWYRLLLEP